LRKFDSTPIEKKVRMKKITEAAASGI